MSVFICYRRGEDAALIYAFHAKLESLIGQANVFMDLNTLLPGQEFSKETAARLKVSSLVFVMINPGWEDSFGSRKNSAVPDFVLRELEIAKHEGIDIVPVLIGRMGERLDGSKLPAELKYLLSSDPEEISSQRFPIDFETFVRRMTFAYPRIFGMSNGPAILSDDVMKRLNEIPVFSRRAVRPAQELDVWSKEYEYECAVHGGDDFRFSIYRDGQSYGVCFFGGTDYDTIVSLCGKPGKSTGFLTAKGIRSQYGFYWPQYYFTLCGSYGARDYFYDPVFTGSAFIATVGEYLLDWVFMRNRNKEHLVRGERSEHPMGCATRGNASDDVIFFSTNECKPIQYFWSFNGLQNPLESTVACQGTNVEWSQIGGGYRDFAFVLKGSDRYHAETGHTLQYFGVLKEHELHVRAVEVGEREEVFPHPSGLAVVLRRSSPSDIRLDIVSIDDADGHLGSVTFAGLGGDYVPKLSFSRDGRSIALSHPWHQKVYILDMFTGTLIGEIPEHVDAKFSPDGERILAVRASASRVASVFSKYGLSKRELGLVDYEKPLQFGYFNNSNHNVRPASVWCDTGRRVFLLHNTTVSTYLLED